VTKCSRFCFLYMWNTECDFAGKFQMFCRNVITLNLSFSQKILTASVKVKAEHQHTFFVLFSSYLYKCWQLTGYLKNNKWDITGLEHWLVIVIESSRMVEKIQRNTYVLDKMRLLTYRTAYIGSFKICKLWRVKIKCFVLSFLRALIIVISWSK